MTTEIGNTSRLFALDIFRGGTVLLMILVNSTWGEDSFEMLLHSEWNGITPCDFIFPVFIYIVGISCYLSLNKKEFKATNTVLIHITKRIVLLFLAGLVINWAFLSIRETPTSFEHLRVWRPLQRIALCYGFVAIFALYFNHKYIVHTIIFLLAIYTLLLICGNGYSMDPQTNILTKVDTLLFGYGHIYHRSPVDPEGLLGLIPSFANALLGFYCGKIICGKESIKDKLVLIFFCGTILLVAGYLMSYGMPINKKVWSPSFVLMSCGVASLILASLIYIIDIKEQTFYKKILIAFGSNALAMYIISQLLLAVFIATGFCDWWYSIIYGFIDSPKWSSLLFAISNTCIYSMIGLYLYKHKLILHI